MVDSFRNKIILVLQKPSIFLNVDVSGAEVIRLMWSVYYFN